MMLPQGKTTNFIAAATVAVYFALALTGLSDPAALLGGFIPARVGTPGLLDHADMVLPVVPVALTPLTATLLHAGLLHLGFNMLTLVFCGRQVEVVLGGRLLLPLYVVGAYTAALGQWVVNPHEVTPMIGASGAISAVVGAYALLYSRQEVRGIGPIPSHWVRMIWLGIAWTVLQTMVALAGATGGPAQGLDLSRIAVGAHIGGFVGGMILTRPLLRRRFARNRY